MRIYNEVLKEVLDHMPLVPPESGGIMGGKGGIVSLREFDAGSDEKGCVYCPNVSFLNHVIAGWIDRGYDFMGIFHVHFGSSKTLSDGDKRYIEKIMKEMPDFIERLYFPIIVQPEKLFVSNLAYRDSLDKIVITPDKVELLF